MPDKRTRLPIQLPPKDMHSSHARGRIQERAAGKANATIGMPPLLLPRHATSCQCQRRHAAYATKKMHAKAVEASCQRYASYVLFIAVFQAMPCLSCFSLSPARCHATPPCQRQSAAATPRQSFKAAPTAMLLHAAIAATPTPAAVPGISLLFLLDGSYY